MRSAADFMGSGKVGRARGYFKTGDGRLGPGPYAKVPQGAAPSASGFAPGAAIALRTDVSIDDAFLATLRGGLTTASAGETRAWASRLAGELPDDCVLALHGTLGVGKTTFVQGLAEGFGITGHVTSPTFTIYTIHQGPRRQLVHLDAYRLSSPGQVESLLLEEFLRSPYCLAVEWPENVADWIPAGAWHLDLGIAVDERHTLRLR